MSNNEIHHQINEKIETKEMMPSEKLKGFKDSQDTYSKFYRLDNDVQKKVLDQVYGRNDEVKIEKEGGSYGELYVPGEGDTKEVHHMPADSISPLDRFDGPAIKMDKVDHRLTASCGSSLEAREYRAKQKELIQEGKFSEAFKMDVQDLKDKGLYDKYEIGITQALSYVNNLIQGGIING